MGPDGTDFSHIVHLRPPEWGETMRVKFSQRAACSESASNDNFWLPFFTLP